MLYYILDWTFCCSLLVYVLCVVFSTIRFVVVKMSTISLDKLKPREILMVELFFKLQIFHIVLHEWLFIIPKKSLKTPQTSRFLGHMLIRILIRNLKFYGTYYMAVILNWRFLRLNSWPDCVAISWDIAIHGSISLICIWFMSKMLDHLIQKFMFSHMGCMRNLPIIIYTKPPI